MNIDILSLQDMIKFIVRCRDDFDCDKDAHKYGNMCRSCIASKLIPEDMKISNLIITINIPLDKIDERYTIK